MAQKCVHKGCGKVFTDPDEPCVYHPGPPEFHEGQKGWKCCKPRVLTFDEFLEITPCTTGTHSTVDDTPQPAKKPQLEEKDLPKVKPIATTTANGTTSVPTPQTAFSSPSSAPQPGRSFTPKLDNDDSDDATLAIPPNATCKRRRCGKSYNSTLSRDEEECIHHPGHPIFHEGSKGWTCCKRRVLEFDEFMKIEGCNKRKRHMFVGKPKPKQDGEAAEEEKVDNVRNDFYQTSSTVIVSFYLKKIDKEKASVEFESDGVELDLPTSDKKRLKQRVPLYGKIEPEKSTFKIMGTKLEMTLAKADGIGWPVLRSDDETRGEIIQVGKAGRA